MNWGLPGYPYFRKPPKGCLKSHSLGSKLTQHGMERGILIGKSKHMMLKERSSGEFYYISKAVSEFVLICQELNGVFITTEMRPKRIKDGTPSSDQKQIGKMTL